MDHRVDEFIARNKNYSKILTTIRKVILSTELVETIKWGMPTYMINKKNVLGIGAFKSHYGIWFFQGSSLKDSNKVLKNAQEGKTKAMRQLRFNKDSKIDIVLLKSYILEAIDNEKNGVKLSPTKKPLIIPIELQKVFSENELLFKSFNALTLTMKREFSDYISEAKKEQTKVKRLEKIIPLILNSKGLHESYKNC